MWGIRRIYLDGIGARAARFRDLDLDLTSERTQESLHSLVWLRNGGGKSSLIALIGALLRPDKNEFLSATSKRRDAGGRCLGDYILDGDTGHVVIEWGEDDGLRRLITGAVYEWPDRQAPPDPNRDQERLRQIRYIFVPVAGTAEIDRMPFVVGGNRTHADHFVANIRAWANVTTVEFPKSQADWSARLDAHGIDSDLWRTIVEMNKTEGGIDDLFLFSHPNDFVKYLIKLIVDPAEIDPVAGLLRDVSEQLALRPDTIADLSFARGAIEKLTELEHAHEDDSTARGLVREAEEGARSLRASLQAAADLAKEQSDLAESDRSHAAQEQRDAESAADIARFTALEYRRLAAVLRRDAAALALSEQSVRTVAAEEIAETWATTTDVARFDNATERLSVLRDQLTRVTIDAEPLRQRLAESAAHLAGALDGLATKAESEAQAANLASRALAADAANAADDQVVAAKAAARLEARREELGRRLSEFDSSLEALRTAGVLEPGEEPGTGLDRLSVTDNFHKRRADELNAEVGAITAAIADAGQALRTATRETLDARGVYRLLVHERDVLESTITGLAAEPRLETLVQADVDPVGMSTMLVERLELEIRRAQKNLIESGVEDAEDSRATNAIEEVGLLPPALDLARALDLLARHKVPAVSGWNYLADVVAPERHGTLMRAAPLLLGAVLVHDPAHLSRAEELLAQLEPRPSSVIAVATTADLESAPASSESATPIVAPNTGLYDRSAAVVEREVRDAARAARAQRELGLAISRDNDQILLARVESLARSCPPGHIDDLDRRISDASESLRMCGLAEDAAAALVDTLSGESARISHERQSIGDERRRLAGHMARLSPLAAQSEPIEAMRLEAVELPNKLAHERDREQAQKAKAERARDQSSGAHDRAVVLSRQASEFRGKRLSLPPQTISKEPPAGLGLDTLETVYQTADRLWREATSESSVAAELREAEVVRADAAKALEAIPVTRISKARELLATPAGSNHRSREDAIRAARDSHGDQNRELWQCQAEHDSARRELSDLEERFSGERERFRQVEEPADRADALTRAASAEAQQQRHSAAMSSAGKRADVARLKRDDQRALFDSFGTRATVIDLPLDAERRTDLPFVGSPEDARTRVTGAIDGMRVAREELSRTRERLVALATTTLYWANSSEFHHVPAEVRERFLSPSYTSETGPIAVLMRRQFEINRDSLANQLEKLDEHRQNVISRAMGLARIALRDIERFSRLSEVPPGLSGWTGHRFVEVGPKTPPDLADPVLRDRIGRAVDSIIDKRSLIDGTELLWRSLEAVVGEPGFRARVLKPSASLELERVSVELMGKWSGGEKVTAAILLFTTIARLRAANRGRTLTGGAGVLILDNPVGKANYVGFLQLQIKIAEAAGVQLLFFTGISDLRSIDRFPNILRMRNTASGDRQYVRTGEREQDDSAIAVARGQRLVEAQELFPV